MRTMVEELVRAGIPATRCLTGPQESAPSATKKSRAANTVTEKTSTSTSSCAKIGAKATTKTGASAKSCATG